MAESLREQQLRFKIGVLCYDLQAHTETFLYAIAQASPHYIKVYPLFFHPNQTSARVPYRPSMQKPRHFGVSRGGSIPEGFVSNVNLLAAFGCARESDLVVLMGLQGATALVCALWARMLGKIVISVNQTLPVQWEKKRRWWIKLAKQWLLRRCHIHIYQSPASREVLRDVYNCPEADLYGAPYHAGANTYRALYGACTKSRDEIRHSYEMTDTVVYLFAGNLVAFKGVPDIIEAAAKIRTHKKFLCLFVGREEPKCKTGGTAEYFRHMALRLGIGDRVQFAGELSAARLVELYLAADAVLLPTHKDCFPKVLVEAALAGKPLITTTACGSAGVIVQHLQNGFVIEPGDITALAEAMEQLLDEELRERMGSRSFAIVNHFCGEDRSSEIDGFCMAIQHGCLLRSGRNRADS